ncbi:hypothetical protein [Legionella nagasakiensis]|uniref:hypothetical protein n=1 Tax=Legionella nagasakiensis TaxID=535290 RepID=UPI001054ED38|nr:hypothetical protein [Legionella nagasakiensis]
MQKTVFIMALALLLSACASYYSSNGEKKYLESRNGLNLVVPPPLTSANISHFYDLPPQNQNPRVNIEPPQN